MKVFGSTQQSFDSAAQPAETFRSGEIAMQLTIAALRRRFSYHQPNTEEKIERHQRVRNACFEAADEIRKVTEPSREQSTAITRLEEAMFWANAAIARPPEQERPRG